jgi:hypothetical protein
MAAKKTTFTGSVSLTQTTGLTIKDLSRYSSTKPTLEEAFEWLDAEKAALEGSGYEFPRMTLADLKRAKKDGFGFSIMSKFRESDGTAAHLSHYVNYASLQPAGPVEFPWLISWNMYPSGIEGCETFNILVDGIGYELRPVHGNSSGDKFKGYDVTATGYPGHDGKALIRASGAAYEVVPFTWYEGRFPNHQTAYKAAKTAHLAQRKAAAKAK